MSYTFHKVQCHSKCPDLTAWYLELRPNDLELRDTLHASVSIRNFQKYGMDPHLSATHNHLALSVGWLTSIERCLCRDETVLVNSAGGYIQKAHAIILETVESDTIDWDIHHVNEQITLSRWPDGSHWYLSSNCKRLFINNGYARFETALDIAKLYTDNVVVIDKRYG